MADTVQLSVLGAERRLPLRSLLISLTGAITAAAITAYGERVGIDKLSPALIVFGVLMLLMMIGQWPTLGYYMFSPKQLVFGERAMTYGARAYPYVEMMSIGSHASKAATKIRMSNGEQHLLRWDVWRGSETWERILERRTLPSLYGRARAALEKGEQVAFGQRVSLGPGAISLPNGRIAIDAISTIRFVNESNMGAHRRILHIGDGHRELTADEDHLFNQHVLLALLAEKLAKKAGPGL